MDEYIEVKELVLDFDGQKFTDALIRKFAIDNGLTLTRRVKGKPKIVPDYELAKMIILDLYEVDENGCLVDTDDEE